MSRFSPVSVVSPANQSVVLPFWPCLVGLCRCECLQFRLNVVHGHSNLCQLRQYFWFRPGKDCIGLYQSFHIIALCLHELHYGFYILSRLMMLFWCGRVCTIYVLHRCGVPIFSCGCYRFSMLLVCLVEEQLVFWPHLLFGGLTSPLSDVIVENPHLRQNHDPFGHHHGTGDYLTSYLRELSPLLQFFYQSGKGFRGDVGPHHLHCILFKVNFIDFPVTGEHVSNYGEYGHLSEPC